MSGQTDVVVVGSGPNGLAAAVILAAAGLSVEVLESQSQPGGGCRTVELDLGVRLPHDLCSAVHPMAVASPFFQAFGLAERGVQFVAPTASYAHPLDGGRAAVAYQDLARTTDELAEDDPTAAKLWNTIMRPLTYAGDSVRCLGLSDLRSIPGAALAPRGLPGAIGLPIGTLCFGTPLWDWLNRAELCGALLTGVAAHAKTTIPSLAGAATALLLGTLAHTSGWPIPIGGSQAITDALLGYLRERGIEVRCDCRIDDPVQLPPARVYAFDTSPWTITRLFGDLLPVVYRRAIENFRPGSGVAKVDFVLSGPVPWADPRVGLAGTVHLGGTRQQMKHAEAETAAGRHSPHPVMLVSNPTVVDQTRLAPGGQRPLWSYAHVPNGSKHDITEVATGQIERFAPGFRDVVVASRCIPASEMAEHNPNYIGGDIAVGQVSLYRMMARPAPKWDPYRTPLGNVYLCSSATPPGPGVHGMSGMHAAQRILKQHFGIARLPALT